VHAVLSSSSSRSNALIDGHVPLPCYRICWLVIASPAPSRIAQAAALTLFDRPCTVVKHSLHFGFGSSVVAAVRVCSSLGCREGGDGCSK